MAIRFYRPQAAGTELDLYIDPQKFTQADDIARRDELLEVQAASDFLRTELAIGKSLPNLASFDAIIEDELFEILDRLDYYAYTNRTEGFDVRDHDWFTPDAIEGSPPFTNSNPSANSIDGDFGTVWRNNADIRHEITYRLRSYPKKVTSLRIRHGGGEPLREQLQNIDAFFSKTLASIDDPIGQRLTGENPI